MVEATERPKRCCAKCGAKVRVDTDYCASCRGAVRGAPYAQRAITLRDIREAARHNPLAALAVVAGALVLVWMLAGSGIGLLTSAILALGITAILWALVRNDRKGKDLGSGPRPRPDRPHSEGPIGWELGEIERGLERLYARKRRDRAWYVVGGLAFLVVFGVIVSVVGEYAVVFALPPLFFVALLMFGFGGSTGDRIAYLERRKAYLEREG